MIQQENAEGAEAESREDAKFAHDADDATPNRSLARFPLEVLRRNVAISTLTV